VRNELDDQALVGEVRGHSAATGRETHALIDLAAVLDERERQMGQRNWCSLSGR
jgi:hypothetical protein